MTRYPVKLEGRARPTTRTLQVHRVGCAYNPIISGL